MHPLRLSLVLIVLLSVAVYGAAGRAVTASGTMIVICGATGAETIWLDADGNPAKAPTPCCTCLDCLTLLAGNLPDPVAILRPERLLAVVPTAAVIDPVAKTYWPATLPRGPPACSKTGTLT